MASPKSQYPDYLNPFGDDAEDDEDASITKVKGHDDYPEYLSPFGTDEVENEKAIQNGFHDDYDDSLNPFGDDADEPHAEAHPEASKISDEASEKVERPSSSIGDNCNNYAQDQRDQEQNCMHDNHKKTQEDQSLTENSQPNSLEPPKPLPRTKSLLKKEQASKRRQQQLEQHQQLSPVSDQTTTLQNSSSITTVATSQINSFQRKKNKRNAPPLPINFKRQVCGSLDAIEEELESIGNKLDTIEKEYILCQETLKARDQLDESETATTRIKVSELIRRKNSILRHQRELMYNKRELKLDQIHSDIEYELRMIVNKQLSNRTTDDEIKEKELLMKLVEIVEEKNDIVENLNKELPCDKDEIEEAFKRLGLFGKSNITPDNSPVDAKKDCDKTSRLAKLGKIATLLPRSGTIKGTVKTQKRRLFKKKCDSQTIDG